MRPGPPRARSAPMVSRTAVGMVREVVDHRDAAFRAALLQPALHSAETLQRLQRRLRLDADVFGRHQRGQRVQPVVMAREVELQFADGASRCA